MRIIVPAREVNAIENIPTKSNLILGDMQISFHNVTHEIIEGVNN